MFGRRAKAPVGPADKADTAGLAEAGVAQNETVLVAKVEVAAGRKPSERFVRKALCAKSKAHESERRRLADLASRLKGRPGRDGVLNEAMKLNCYRPEVERPPG